MGASCLKLFAICAPWFSSAHPKKKVIFVFKKEFVIECAMSLQVYSIMYMLDYTKYLVTIWYSEMSQLTFFFLCEEKYKS